jgi:hypothetical protein
MSEHAAVSKVSMHRFVAGLLIRRRRRKNGGDFVRLTGLGSIIAMSQRRNKSTVSSDARILYIGA